MRGFTRCQPFTSFLSFFEDWSVSAFFVFLSVFDLSLSLDIQLGNIHSGTQHEFPNSLNLPALNYLKLRAFSFCSANDDGRIEPFSTFKRLNTLILSECFVLDAQTLCISNTKLLNLSISSRCVCHLISKLELSTPNLCSFTFIGRYFLKLYGSSLDSIKEARIDVNMDMEHLNHADNPLILLNWLKELVNIKSLTVSEYTLQALSLIPDLFKVEPPSWYNLKSLKADMPQNERILSMMEEVELNLKEGGRKSLNAKFRKAIERARLELSILEGIVEFLLQNSPSVKVDIVKFSPM